MRQTGGSASVEASGWRSSKPCEGWGRAVPPRHPSKGWRRLPTVGTVAACGFGGILYKVITSPQVLSLLESVISKAFHLSF